MPLMPRLASFFQIKYLYCVPLIWISLQLKGYYWLLLLLLLFALFRLKDSLANIVFVGRQSVLTALLLVFSFSLLTAATVQLGLKGLISEMVPIYKSMGCIKMEGDGWIVDTIFKPQYIYTGSPFKFI